MGKDLDLSSYAFAKNPHPTYAMLRETCPVHRDEGTGSWYVSRFDDVRGLLVDERLRCQRVRRSTGDLPESQRRQTEEIDDFLATWPIFNHMAGHAVIRKAVLSSLGPAAIRALEPSLVRWTNDVAARVAASDDGDIVADFARPVALHCLAVLLGAPAETVRMLRTMSDRILDYLLLQDRDADTTARAHEAMARLTAFADDALASGGSGGLVTGPLARLDQQGRVEHAALVGTIAEFVQGTVEPLTTTVCVAVHGIGCDPSLREGLGSGAIDVEAVVEEALRFDPPFHLVQRVPDRPIELDGQTIDAGSEVFLVIAAANRDGTRWTDAERFDPTRARRRHITFGLGPHACPGGPLVRLQATAALRAAQAYDLLGRFGAQTLGRLPIVDETRFRRVR
jgi:cytochrome P450